ncbi:MAG: low-specificity L-threonine aldolase [Pseudomonadales bacterium]|nr:low-specificity L-threonine aldolase [Pseudomonadales bacterium]
MLDAMLSAPTGDDVYGEDPTVNALEAKIAAMTGKDAALFVASGTQGNLLALMSHCQRGEEYIAGQDAHTYRFEGGGGAVLGGIQPQPLPFNDRGELDLDQVRAVIKPDNFHFAITRLVCLENTTSGKVLSLEYLDKYVALTESFGLSRHLDGARVFNAAVALGVPVKTICDRFDSVSICLSKGLGCPVGSALVGSRALIEKARRLRKMVGGGMRQAGILAAAGIYALDHNVERLAEDHANAERLASGLVAIGVALQEGAQTNMVMMDDRQVDIPRLRRFLATRDITISGSRLVTHLDVSTADIDTVLGAIADFRKAA